MNGLRDALLASAAGAVTTAGDTVYATAANTLARLPVGTAGQVFRVNAGATAPEWSSTFAGAYFTGNAVNGYRFRNQADSTTLLTLGDAGLATFVGQVQAPNIALGTTPAGTGAIRLPNNAFIYARNAANSSDYQLFGLDSGNLLQIGAGVSNGVRIGGYSGPVFMGYATLYFRNVSDSADIEALGPTSANDVYTARNFVPKTDNAWTCGANGLRWVAVWAVNGTIQTSTRDAKNLRGSVDSAAALAAIQRTPLYRFTYKGDDPVLADYQHVGFLADEADPLLCPDGASASPNTTASVALAAIQELARRLDALEARP